MNGHGFVIDEPEDVDGGAYAAATAEDGAGGGPQERDTFADEWGRSVDANGNLLDEQGQLLLDETGSPVYAYDVPPADGEASESRTK